MKHEFIINNGSNSLVVMFAGWGVSPTLFSDIDINYDFLIIYDYNDFQLDIAILEKYSNIYLFAWSFGVLAASAFIQNNPQLPICLKIAINGTVTPIDDNEGIPEAIFKGTLESLSERSLLKFYRRICYSSKQYDDFLNINKQRDIESLRTELRSVYEYSSKHDFSSVIWDKAIVSSNDNIFPSKNQHCSWRKKCKNIIEIDGAHLPICFNKILNDNIINKPLLKLRFTKQLSNYNNSAICQQDISKKLYTLWKNNDFRIKTSILEIGCGTGFLTKLYYQSFTPNRLILNDICKIPSKYFNDINEYQFIQGDAETINFSQFDKFDYIVSASTIQWFENPSKFFDSINNILRDNGVIAISTFGKKNMKEIKDITGISLNYIDIDRIIEMMVDKYDLLQVEEDEQIIYFDTPLDILRHIKATGVNSISTNQRWTKSQLNDFTKKYCAVDNRYPLTYNPIYIIARKK